jgi:hypothetical protein
MTSTSRSRAAPTQVIEEKRIRQPGVQLREAAAAIDRKHGIFDPLALAATSRKKQQ